MDHTTPTFLYGTAWKEERTSELVELALTVGFRGIDTANQRMHYFEEAVGQGLQQAYNALGIQRDDIFLQTKFTYARGQDHRKPYDEHASFSTQVQQSFESSLDHLKTDYLNSYILHGPYQQHLITEQDKEVWSAMESLYKQGKVKHLGVSNITHQQLTELLEFSSIKPAFVQNRCFAQMFWDKQVRTYCKNHGMIYQGFSLLTANQHELMHHKLMQIIKNHQKSLAQVIFRFSQQVGMIPLTGTTDATHMNEDLDIDDFMLTDYELHLIENIAV